MDGGCECGQIRYRIQGPPIFVNCCHCRQCQKITGSAFALNAMIEADRVEVIAGSDDLRWTNGEVRCSECGVLLWSTHRFFGDDIFFLRVGTLDESEGVTPDAHFFLRSKHPWVSVPEGARAFETRPSKEDLPLYGPEVQARLQAAGSARLAPDATPG